MATIEFNTLDVFAGVTEDLRFEAELYGSDGDYAELAEADVVHAVLSERVRGEPDEELLAIDSSAATANGSKVYVTDRGSAITGAPAVGYVRLAQADTDAIVDAWAATVANKQLVLELWYVDSVETSPASARKLFLRGVIHLHRSAAQG